jgi:NRPS condensation-like uncharacterized protein
MTVRETGARPLPPAQEAILFESRQTGESRVGALACNVQTVLEITGFVDIAALQRAVDAVVRADPVLLSGFGYDAEGRPISFQPREAVLRLRTVNLRELSPAERFVAAQRLEEHERSEEFPLGAPPLIRLLLSRIEDRERRLVVTSHRILLDSWSHADFVSALVGGFCSGLPRIGVRIRTLSTHDARPFPLNRPGELLPARAA